MSYSVAKNGNGNFIFKSTKNGKYMHVDINTGALVFNNDASQGSFKVGLIGKYRFSGQYTGLSCVGLLVRSCSKNFAYFWFLKVFFQTLRANCHLGELGR